MAEHKISNNQFLYNLALMSGLFTMFSFSFWLIDFQQEYLGSDIYFNFYLAGFVTILSGQVNLILYSPLGLRSLIQMVLVVMISTCAFIILVPQKILKFQDEEMEI